MVANTLLQDLSEILLRPVAAADRERAAEHLLDWLGCALGAQDTAIATGLRQWVSEMPAPASGLHLLGLKHKGREGRGEAQTALLYNGALGNILEMDDIHGPSILHPGPVVVPAALGSAEMLLAAGQQVRPSDLLDALVRGYEAVIRIGRALGPSHYRFWHSTSTCGAFGAAAAAASLHGFGATAMASALGLAGTRTGGLWQLRHEETAAKSWHNGEACRSGVMAARFVTAGLHGVHSLLEGEHGLFAATAPDADPSALVRGDDDWLIHATGFKPWPCCRHAQPTLDAALRLADQLQLADIAEVTVHTYGAAVDFCDRPQVASEQDAKFSLQHAAALGLAGNGRQLAEYRPESLQTPQIAARRRLVKVHLDEALDRAWPEHYGAKVRVRTADGTEISAEVADAPGDPGNPLAAGTLTAKAQMLFAANPELTSAQVEQLLAAVHQLPTADSLEALFASLP